MPLPSFIHKLLFAPFVAQVVVTRQCNLACAYCGEHSRNGGPVPAGTLEKRLDRLKRLGTWIITLTGGEPALHPELGSLVRHCRRIGFFRVSLISNGVGLGKSLIEALNAAGLQEIQVSVDGIKENGITRKVLDNLWGSMEALRVYARFNVTVNAVAGACPPHEFQALVDWAGAVGFTLRVGLMHGEAGQLCLSRDARVAYGNTVSTLPRTIRDFSGYRNRLIRTGSAPFKCRAGSRFIYVDEGGRVAMCSQTRARWSMPLQDFGPPQLNERFYASKPCQDRCTLGCVRSCSQFENWRRQNKPKK